ncbi:MAG: hypothetical protein RG741_04065 [Bacteroidales bacterium]|nr:hypothetical protein [Bacteroidales bacterium]
MQKQNRRTFLQQLLTLPALGMAGRLLPFPLFFASPVSSKNTSMHTTGSGYTPNYVQLHKSGELKARGEILHERMRNCDLCPRDCFTDRISGQRGDCNANADLEISSASPHFGEERELVGRHGSGTIFFTNCSLLCVFCINYEISQLGHGRRYGTRELASMMLLLQRRGCHNINVVTPTHYIPHILLALDHAASRGLTIPLAYNTSGWEKTEVLEFLDGVVDIYLADFKYGDSSAADKYSPGAANYPELAQKAMLEMHRQVGVAIPDPDTDLIYKGLMIRHLVMPENVAASDRVIRWIAANLPKDTYLNIMSQYTPVFKALDHPEIARRITRSEYNNAVHVARNAGLTNLRLQMR